MVAVAIRQSSYPARPAAKREARGIAPAEPGRSACYRSGDFLTLSPPRSGPLDPAWITTADTLPVVVWTLGPDGRIEFINRRWFDLTGLPPAAVLDHAWRETTHPDDREAATQAVLGALERGESFSVDSRALCADGSHRWFRSQAAPMHDENGRIVRWFGVSIDIDESKSTARALEVSKSELADSERKFRALAEAIPVICWTADASGWIDWYNHRWYEYTGQSREEAAGWGWQAAHHPDDFLEVMRKWPYSIATGAPFEMEFRLRRADGAFHWFLTRVEPLRDEAGRIVRWYGSNVDIDAQKQALEKTKRVAETLQDIFLPKGLPNKPDLRFDAIYLPAEKDALVGGDWFDAFDVPDGRIVFSIGDVAGHGLPASILVGRLRQAIFTLAFNFDDPATILRETDRILRHQEPETMVTALVGFVNQSRTEIQYASAGHPPPMLATSPDKPAATLPYGSAPLGVDGGSAFKTHVVPIEPNAVVALYTDGMIEFTRDVIAIENKLRTAVALLVGNTTVARPAMAIKEIVFEDMPPADDAALLLMQFSAVDGKVLQTDPAALRRTWRFHSSDAYTAHTSRQEIVRYLRNLAADADQVFAGELILGEILANTVEHAPGLVEVTLDWTGEKPVVTVRDTGPGLRNLKGRLPTDAMEEGGRGIFLIKSLAEDVAVKPSPGYGTELRATLPVRRALRP